MSDNHLAGNVSSATPWHRTAFIAVTAWAIAGLALWACSEKVVEPAKPAGPRTVTVTPASGTPLTPVVIHGISGAQLIKDVTVAFFGDDPAPLFTDSAGVVSSTIPVVYDSVNAWTADSVELSLTIVNIFTGDTIALGVDVFSLEPLPPAPGTAAQLQSDLQRISSALGVIAATFHSGPGEEEMFNTAAIFALDSLISAPDTLSLAGALAKLRADDPDALLLLDALLAASGIAEQTSGFAAIFEEMAASFAARQFTRPLNATTLTDEELAYRMQLYVVVLEFGRTVVKPTASTYSLITGPIGLFVSIPVASITGAILKVADFIINKFVVALLPAKIDDFTLEFAADTIEVGATTEAKLHLTASNEPPGITVQEVFDLILAGLGYTKTIVGAKDFAKIKDLDKLNKVMKDVTNYLLGLYRKGLKAYASAHQELNLDPDVGSMPSLTWEADIEQKKFVELTTFTPAIVNEDAVEINWVALGPDWGEGRVYARTTADPSAIVIPQPPGFAYTGGAFGNNVERTETRSIWVKPNLVLRLTMPQSVQNAAYETMRVQAGYEVPAPPAPYRGFAARAIDTIWSPNINLTLTPSGGSAQQTSGVTDANGEFTTGLLLADGSSQITLTVNGAGDVGSEAVAQGVAAGINPDQIYIRALYGGQKSASIMPGATVAFKSHVFRQPFFQAVAGVPVTWTPSNATIVPVSPTTDAKGLAAFEVTLDAGADSTLVIARADAGGGNTAVDTAVIYSYCHPHEPSTYTEGGVGTYTANGNLLGGTLSASAAVGSSSGAEIRTSDRISVIAADSARWTENCIVWLNVSYSFTATGGVQASGWALEAEISSPGQFPYKFAGAKNLGVDVSDNQTVEVPVRGIPLAPYAHGVIGGRYRVTANPDPDYPDNTGISNTLTVTVIGISKVTLADGETPVAVLCAQTGSGLSYSN